MEIEINRTYQLTFKVTVEEIFNRGLWYETCEVTGINEWAVNEGLISNDDIISLTEKQAIEIGLITR